MSRPQLDEGDAGQTQPVQMAGEDLIPLPAEVPPAGGAGRALPPPVRGRMELAFGADFSDVRIHEGPAAPAIGAEAYAQGSDVHFAPGRYDPDSPAGQHLLGHELTHVVQQRAGRAQGVQGKGVAINADPALEAEAERAGAQAARGETVEVAGANEASPPPAASSAVIQGYFTIPQADLATQGVTTTSTFRAQERYPRVTDADTTKPTGSYLGPTNALNIVGLPAGLMPGARGEAVDVATNCDEVAAKVIGKGAEATPAKVNSGGMKLPSGSKADNIRAC